MAKKKGPADPFKVLDNMLTNMSEGEKDFLISMMEQMSIPGKHEEFINKKFFVDNRKDYTSIRKPMSDTLLPLYQAQLPIDVLSTYSAALPLMEAMPRQQREEEARNYLFNLLADAPQHIVDPETSCLHLYGLLAIMEKLDITGLADELIELLRQDMHFFSFYFNGYEDIMALALSKLCRQSLPQLKKFMLEAGRIPEMKHIVLDAVTHRAETHPEARLETVSFLSSLLGEWLNINVYPTNAERLIYNLARLRATETLPLIRRAYQQIDLPNLFVDGGYKGVQRLMKTGCEAITPIEQDSVEQLLNILSNYDDNHPNDDDISDPFNLADDNFLPFFFNNPDSDYDYSWLADTENMKSYHLTVTLQNSPIPVTRELVVPSTIEMTVFENILAIAMGWESRHLSCFIKGKERYMSEDNMDAGDMHDDEVEMTDGMSLDELLLRKGSSIKWEYDFGDSWTHEIKVTATSPLERHDSLGVRLEAAGNACPPEDCGGVWGYQHLLEVLADKKHPEYKEIKQWVPRGFNPNKFNIKNAQKQIDKYLKNY